LNEWKIDLKVTKNIFLAGNSNLENAWISLYASGAVFCATLCLDSTGISSGWIHWLVLDGFWLVSMEN
jgi:hypothetical protein